MKRWLALCLILAITAILGAGVCAVALSTERQREQGSLSNEKLNDDEKLIVTSFYPVYIIVKNLVENVPGVRVVNLAGRHQGCLHDYQLTTDNMRLLEEASVFVINGGGMEGFISEVARECEGLKIISCGQDGEEENAHYWMNPDLYVLQVGQAARELGKWDAENKEIYEENGKEYCEKVKKLSDKMDSELSGLRGGHVISLHEALYYLADRLGVDIDYTMDLDGEVYLSAGEIAGLRDVIEDSHVEVIWMDSEVKQEFSELAKKDGSLNTVKLDTLIFGEDDKDAYLKGMEKNIELLKGLTGK